MRCLRSNRTRHQLVNIISRSDRPLTEWGVRVRGGPSLDGAGEGVRCPRCGTDSVVGHHGRYAALTLGYWPLPATPPGSRRHRLSWTNPRRYHNHMVTNWRSGTRNRCRPVLYGDPPYCQDWRVEDAST